MLDLIADPSVWVLVAIVLAVGAVVGRFAHDPWWITAMNVLGVLALYAGARLGARLGADGFLVFVLASGAMALTYETARIRQRLKDRAGPADAPADTA